MGVVVDAGPAWIQTIGSLSLIWRDVLSFYVFAGDEMRIHHVFCDVVITYVGFVTV